MKMNLTVGDLIKTEYLSGICRVVAGERGLSRPVGWVHILEIRDIVKDCVDGNELVLTTGICFTDKETAVSFLKELMEQGVAGICIETALYYHVIDRELIEIADENNFPLIEITEISRFKDIAKGLNKLLLEGEIMSYTSVGYFDSKLNEIESKGTLEDGIRYTADYLNLEIAYLPSIGRQFATSDELQHESRKLIGGVKLSSLSDEIYCKGRIALKNLNIGERNYGTLLFKNNHKDITDFDLLILGRLANKIKSELLHEIQVTEETLYKENSWLSEWLKGELSEEDIYRHLQDRGVYADYGEYAVCSFRASENILFSDFVTDMTLFVRKIFEMKSLFVLGYIKEDMAHYIVLNQDKREGLASKMVYAVNRIKGISKTLIHYKGNLFSLGKVVKTSTELNKSFETSLEFLDLEQLKDQELVIFDELHFDRILFHIADTPMVSDFIEDHLGDLLLPENFELLQTLTVFYECNCSKQKTAERLYIVRQTLYFRLQKIEELLGVDFMEGEEKYALEFACKACIHRKRYHKNYGQTECTESSK